MIELLLHFNKKMNFKKISKQQQHKNDFYIQNILKKFFKMEQISTHINVFSYIIILTK